MLRYYEYAESSCQWILKDAVLVFHAHAVDPFPAMALSVQRLNDGKPCDSHAPYSMLVVPEESEHESWLMVMSSNAARAPIKAVLPPRLVSWIPASPLSDSEVFPVHHLWKSSTRQAVHTAETHEILLPRKLFST